MTAQRKPDETMTRLLAEIAKLPPYQQRELLRRAGIFLERRPSTIKTTSTNKPLLTEEVFTPKTSLFQELWKIRQAMAEAGIPFLTLEEIEEELRERRGGVESRGQE